MADAPNDPNAWLGLLKWSLAHQDGTAPSEARPMSDTDRAWLEKVVSEGVRDDFQTMTNIYARLCSYLDGTATAMHPSVPFNDGDNSSSTPIPEHSPAAATPEQHISSGDSERPVVGEPQQQVQSIDVLPPAASTLSVFVAPPPAQPFSAPPSFGGGGGVGAGEGLEDVMNDLEELQDMVEHIDLAATFAKIGGFGRLIALAAPAYRPEKLRLRAASVMATLTKNNPPAQAAFSESGGHRALLQATNNTTAAATNSNAQATGDTATAPPPQQTPTASFALQRAILHALSCSVMGLTQAEDALCEDPRFPEFLARTLSRWKTDPSSTGPPPVTWLWSS